MYAAFQSDDANNTNNPESLEAIKNKAENGELTPEQQAAYDKWSETMAENPEAENQAGDFEATMADVPAFMPGGAEALAAGAVVGAGLDALDPSEAAATPTDIPPEVARPKTTALEQAAANSIEQGGGINASDMTSQAFGGEMGRDAVIQQGEAVKQSLESDKIMASDLENKISQGHSGKPETEALMASATATTTATDEKAKQAEMKAYFGDETATQSLAEVEQASKDLDGAKEALRQAATHVQDAEVAAKATNVAEDIERKQQEISQKVEAAQTILNDAAKTEAEQTDNSLLEANPAETPVEDEPDPAEVAQLETADSESIVEMAKKRNETMNKAAADEMLGNNQLNAA